MIGHYHGSPHALAPSGRRFATAGLAPVER